MESRSASAAEKQDALTSAINKKGRLKMKVREVLDKINKTLECKSIAEKTLKNKTETKNYTGEGVAENYSPYANQTSSQESMTRETAYRAFPEDVVIGWIGQIDGQIRCEILGEDPKSVTLPKWEEDTLAVPDAYCSVYYYYCMAMATLAVGNVADYYRLMDMFEAAMGVYAKSVIRNRG